MTPAQVAPASAGIASPARKSPDPGALLATVLESLEDDQAQDVVKENRALPTI